MARRRLDARKRFLRAFAELAVVHFMERNGTELNGGLQSLSSHSDVREQILCNSRFGNFTSPETFNLGLVVVVVVVVMHVGHP